MLMLILVVSMTNMHSKMVESICRSKILFFDSNPIGRIYTRFSKDVTVVDLILPGLSGLATFAIFRTITVCLVVVAVYPIMLIVVVFVFLLMYCIMQKAIHAQRECLRMDSLYRGPIHSLFAMIVNGLTTLRTFQRTDWFKQGFIDQLEKSTNVTFCFFSINRWMGISLDIVC